MGERYLRSVRLLAECVQGFARCSGAAVRQCGLTHARFDIIATPGNTLLRLKELLAAPANMNTEGKKLENCPA